VTGAAAARTALPLVVVYTRAGCHLCAEAEQVVAAVAAAGGCRVELVDIDADPAITDRYTVRVPVVAVDGRELFEFQVDPDQLRRAIAAAR
jgi:predicted thioredoxin/glutaredoxin